MANLPGDIVVDILSMLPEKSMYRFRCVCKHWNNLLNDHDFLKRRFKHGITKSSSLYAMSAFESNHGGFVNLISPLQETSLNIDIVGSCNGLILLKSHKDYRLESHWIWNPCTKELKELLIPEVEYEVKYGSLHFQKLDRYRCTSYGVGYNGAADYYTIVAATRYCHKKGLEYFHVCGIQVYSLKLNSWKNLPNIFPYEIITMYGKSEVVFVSGAFHWRARRLKSNKTCIVSFDIHDENFNEVAVTPQVDELLNHDLNYNHKALGVLGGSLCILLTQYAISSTIEVWVMKNYNAKESWTKLFIARSRLQRVESEIPLHCVKLLWEFKSGEVLFVTAGGSDERHSGGSDERNCCLVLCDSVSQYIRVTKIQHIPGRRWNIEAYIEKSQCH